MSPLDSLGVTLTLYGSWLTGWALVATARGRRTGAFTAALSLLELGAVAQAAWDLVAAPAGGERVTHLGYLAVSVVLLPLTAAWAGADRSRWGSTCLAIGCAAFAVVVVRLRATAPL